LLVGGETSKVTPGRDKVFLLEILVEVSAVLGSFEADKDEVESDLVSFGEMLAVGYRRKLGISSFKPVSPVPCSGSLT
jgi:hypothetical protein